MTAPGYYDASVPPELLRGYVAPQLAGAVREPEAVVEQDGAGAVEYADGSTSVGYLDPARAAGTADPEVHELVADELDAEGEALPDAVEGDDSERTAGPARTAGRKRASSKQQRR